MKIGSIELSHNSKLDQSSLEYDIVVEWLKTQINQPEIYY
ncbi:5038_t:CDS:2 [Ambispora leptoticha]|uniref:5038_t:CDS:1 n=1 Tax=Ambispora leptoticha TaxID=144679 RepID=A0A9N8WB84_9GLOM|nr:5038_t:CDS:2 [Ambispora leptoticha]